MAESSAYNSSLLFGNRNVGCIKGIEKRREASSLGLRFFLHNVPWRTALDVGVDEGTKWGWKDKNGAELVGQFVMLHRVESSSRSAVFTWQFMAARGSVAILAAKSVVLCPGLKVKWSSGTTSRLLATSLILERMISSTSLAGVSKRDTGW